MKTVPFMLRLPLVPMERRCRPRTLYSIRLSLLGGLSLTAQLALGATLCSTKIVLL